MDAATTVVYPYYTTFSRHDALQISGKYQNGALPKGARKQLFNRMQRYESPQSNAAIDDYLAIAKKHGLDASQMANQFVTTRFFVTSDRKSTRLNSSH